MVLEIRTHPDKGRGGGLKIRDFGGRPLLTAPNVDVSHECHTTDINQLRPYCSTSFSKNIVVLLFIHLINHLNRIAGISPYYKSMVVLCL